MTETREPSRRTPIISRLLLLLILVACSSSTDPTPTPPPGPGTSTLQGSFGIAPVQREAPIGQGLSPLALPRQLGIDGLNRHILDAAGQAGMSTLSLETPIRGLNAAVLGNYLQAQSGQQVLFGLNEQSILAIDKDGNVLAHAPIGSDGQWALELADDVWELVERIGLVQGFEFDDDVWVCDKPLEYEDEDGNRRALFDYSPAAQALSALQSERVSAAGLFNYDRDTGNPSSDEDDKDPDLTPVDDPDFFPDDDELICDDDNVTIVRVTADFDWDTPEIVLQESRLYINGVGFGIDTADPDNLKYVNVAPLGEDGVMSMRVPKPRGVVKNMALVMTDVGLIDERKLDLPLTPTFDLNAAIRAGDPSQPSQIALDEDDYDYGELAGGMVYISGIVRDSNGNPASDALIIGVMDSDEIIAFNLAPSRSDGSYELLLPATGPDLPYYIVAISEDENEIGIPAGLPLYDEDNPDDIRFAFTRVDAHRQANIQLISASASNDISGTITAPAGGDLAGTVVVACYNPDPRGGCDASGSRTTQITSPGASAPYTISNVNPGPHIVYAYRDFDGNGELNAGDYYGFYTTDGSSPALFTAPATDIDLQLDVIGGTGSSITGTVSLAVNNASPSSAQMQALGEQLRERLEQEGAPGLPETIEGDFVPGELIVAFEEGIRLQSVATLHIDGHILTAARPMALANTHVYRTPELDSDATLALAQQLETRADVRYAHPNYIMGALLQPNDQFYNFQWHYPAINLPAAWDITTGSSNTVVAVLDSGILYRQGIPQQSHPDLAGKVLPGYDFTQMNDDPYDHPNAQFHGTHVAGTVAAATNNNIGVAGVDWQAQILPVRVLGDNGTGTLEGIVNGILWSVGINLQGVPANPNPADILNLSLGGQTFQGCAPAYQSAFQEVNARGAIAVVAAGNSNDDAFFFQPANCPGVLTVGATDTRGHRAWYSNYGNTIDIMAPGGDTTVDRLGNQLPDGVLSLSVNPANNQFDYWFQQGTSMASPHVAGLVALMRGLRPTLTYTEARNILLSTSRPLSAAECERAAASDCGAGLIDAAAALQALEVTPPPPPPDENDISGTQVWACRPEPVNNRFECVSQDVIQQTGTSADYELANVPPGEYIVFGWKDNNNNNTIDSGDDFGCYMQGGQQCSRINPPADTIDIVLEPYTGSIPLSVKEIEGALTRWRPSMLMLPE